MIAAPIGNWTGPALLAALLLSPNCFGQYTARESDFASDGQELSIPAGDLKLHAVAYDLGPETRELKPALIHLHPRRENGVRPAALESFYARRSSQRGFYSLAVTMRGWPDTGGVNDCGLRQPEDISQVVDWLATQPGVDPERIAIIGSAQGAQVALLTAAQNPKVKAVAAFHPLTDVTRWAMETDLTAYMIDSYVNGVCAAPGSQFERSPLFVADKIEASVALYHGDRDRRVPLWHSEAMHIALLGSGKNSNLVVIENGQHGFGHPSWGGDNAALDRALDFVEASLHGQLDETRNPFEFILSRRQESSPRPLLRQSLFDGPVPATVSSEQQAALEIEAESTPDQDPAFPSQEGDPIGPGFFGPLTIEPETIDLEALTLPVPQPAAIPKKRIKRRDI